MFVKIESAYVPNAEYYLDNDKFARRLKLKSRRGLSADQIGSVIADYIKMLDSCLKSFFNNIGNIQLAAYEIEKTILSYLNSREATI